MQSAQVAPPAHRAHPTAGYQQQPVHRPGGREAELEEYAGRLSAEKIHLEDHVQKLQATLAGVNRHLEQEMLEKRNAVEELLRKESLLKELEVQFEMYKEEHAKLLASKLEEQREAFNIEKDRINSHFIKTGQEVHRQNDELTDKGTEIAKLQQENSILKEWLDRGVDECRRVADENEKVKGELWDLKSQVARDESSAAQRIAAAEQERDRERGEKDAVSAALHSAQERIVEVQQMWEDDRRHLVEVATQARRMKQRIAALKLIIDRYGGAAEQDPLAILDGDQLADVEDISPDSTDGQRARDAMLRLHEHLNGLQLSTKKLIQTVGKNPGRPAPGPGDDANSAMSRLMEQMQNQLGGMGGDYDQRDRDPPVDIRALLEELEKLRRENSNQQEDMDELHKRLKRKETMLVELEDELDGLRRNRFSASEETEAAQDALRKALQESDRLREEVDLQHIRMQQMTESHKLQVQKLAQDLQALTEELDQIRDYGRQVEQDNDEARRALSAQEAATKQHAEEGARAFQQLQALAEHQEQEHMRQMQHQQAEGRRLETQKDQEIDQQMQLGEQQKRMHQQEIEQLKLLMQQQVTAHEQALNQQQELMRQQTVAHQAALEQQHNQHQQQLMQLQQQQADHQQQMQQRIEELQQQVLVLGKQKIELEVLQSSAQRDLAEAQHAAQLAEQARQAQEEQARQENIRQQEDIARMQEEQARREQEARHAGGMQPGQQQYRPEQQYPTDGYGRTGSTLSSRYPGQQPPPQQAPPAAQQQPEPPPPPPPPQPAVVVVQAPQQPPPSQANPSQAGSEAGGRSPNPAGQRPWGGDPDDYGHASPSHPKLACPLCGSEGFVPGMPCRNCGFTTGQFTRLVGGGGGGQPPQGVPASMVNSAATSPRRWH